MVEINIKETLRKYRRVLNIARKPGKEEFTTSAKVSALGLALIGFVGFVIFMIFQIPTLLGFAGI